MRHRTRHHDMPRLRTGGLALGVLLALGCGTAVAGAAQAQEVNRDGKITKAEYRSFVYSSPWRSWDLDNDGMIEPAEFEKIGFDRDYITDDFTKWDVDRDGYIDPGEFSEFTFTEFDTNEDRQWTRNEWDDAENAGLYNELTSVDLKYDSRARSGD